jgi:hypothetical protein
MFGVDVTLFLRGKHNPVNIPLPATLKEALPCFREQLCRKIYVITPGFNVTKFSTPAKSPWLL